MEPAYRYSVDVVQVKDGCSFEGLIDLGFLVTLRKRRIRLYGVDVASHRDDEVNERLEASAAKEFLRARIEGRRVVCTFHGYDRQLGAWLCTIHLPINQEPGPATSVNDELVARNLASRT
jgi:endonuclease YncB( thermonuclease family)